MTRSTWFGRLAVGGIAVLCIAVGRINNPSYGAAAVAAEPAPGWKAGAASVTITPEQPM